MAFFKTKLVVSILALITASTGLAQQSASQEQVAREIQSLAWVDSGHGAVADVASINASTQARVLVGQPVTRFIELTGNPPRNGATIVAPNDLHWFSVYEYQDVGFVSDKDAVDADALMKSLKETEPNENAERRRLGLDDLTITDWAVKPHYDAATRNLEWGLKIHSSLGEDVINYTTRHLGRGGFVSSILVSSPETFQSDLAEFRANDTKLVFNPGSNYTEFREGDKVAGYGLAALVAGGAAAAAVKSGVGKGILVALAAFWKFILAGVVALFAGVAKFFRRDTETAQEE